MRYLILLIFLVTQYCSLISNAPKIEFADNVVVAHRGAWKSENLPQNSIASLKKAIELKCTGSEFDVRMTSDDVLIVTHDHDYHGLVVEENTYNSLAQYKLDNGETLPTLRNMLKAGMTDNNSTGMVCEIKPSSIAGRDIVITDKVMELVKELGAEPYISSYISFSYDVISRIEELNPQAVTMYLNGSFSPEKLKEDGIDGMDYYFDVFKKKPEWVEGAKAEGLILNAWTVNNKEDIDWFLENEFDYITTDQPELAMSRNK